MNETIQTMGKAEVLLALWETALQGMALGAACAAVYGAVHLLAFAYCEFRRLRLMALDKKCPRRNGY